MAKHAHVPTRARTLGPGRHRKPSTSRPMVQSAVLAGGLTAGAFVVTEAAAPAAAIAATADEFAALRMCESGGNYQTNTGNGYYGAYQFSLATWQSLGYTGYPHQASPATQDEAARRLQARSGWGQWPACSAKLGLGSSNTVFTTATASSATVVSTHTSTAIPSGTFSIDDVRTWSQTVVGVQKDLRQRGYHIKVDGHYGPETEAAVLAFQATHDLKVDGIVGPATLERLAR